MDLLDITLPTMADNVALDEALFRVAEAGDQPLELLRVWQPPELAVVIGRGSRVAEEVQLDYCDRRQIPVLRRISGGAAILTGPGCLMYGLILNYACRPQMQLIDVAHALVLDRMAQQLARIDPGVVRAGTSDLAVRDPHSPDLAARPDAMTPETAGWRKFSGNSMRRGRTHLLYHGTLLFDFDLEEISRCLRAAPRQPKYRGGRPHRDFVTCLSTTAKRLQAALLAAWSPTGTIADWPQTLVAELVEQKYCRDSWNRSL